MDFISLLTNAFTFWSKKKKATVQVKQFIAFADGLLMEEVQSIESNLKELSNDEMLEPNHIIRIPKLLRKFAELPKEIPGILEQNAAYSNIRIQVDHLPGIEFNVGQIFQRYENALTQHQPDIEVQVGNLLSFMEKLKAETEANGVTSTAMRDFILEVDSIVRGWQLMSPEIGRKIMSGRSMNHHVLKIDVFDKLEATYHRYSSNLKAADIMKMVRDFNSAYHHLTSEKQRFISDLVAMSNRLKEVQVSIRTYGEQL